MRAAHAIWTILAAAAASGSLVEEPSPNAGDNDPSTDVKAEPRKLLAEVHYTFGISVSSATSKFQGPGDSKLQCNYCADAYAGLKYWRSFINTMGSFTTTEGNKRIYVKVEEMEDNGDLATMKSNYESLATWNSRQQTGARQERMVALFGPFFVDWNEHAARIADKHNMVMILWAFEFGNYQTLPGPERRPQDSPVRRLLLEEGIAQGTCPSDGTGCSDEAMALPGETDSKDIWEPGVISRRHGDGHGKEAAARSLQVQALGAGTGEVMCMEDEWVENPILVTCSPVQDGPDQSLLVASKEHKTITIVPKGTRSFSLTVEVVNTGPPTPMEIYSLDASGVRGPCLYSFPNRTQVCLSSGANVSRPQCQPCACDGLTPGALCSVNGLPGFPLTIRPVGGPPPSTIKFTVTDSTVDLLVTLRNRAPVDKEHRLQFSHMGVTPCPVKTLGCRPCASYNACPAGTATDPGYAACNGTRYVDCVSEANPDGEVWSNGYDTIFDINLAPTSWAKDAIDQVYKHGARKLIFVYMSKAIVNDVSWSRQCRALSNYALTLGNSDTEVILYEMKRTDGFMSDMRFLRAEDADAFIHCGRLNSMVLFTMGAKAFTLQAKTFISDRPFGFSLINDTKGFNINYFMEPVAMKYNTSKSCVIFDNYKVFVEGFEASDFHNGKVSYASMQVAAMGALMTEAIRSLPRAELTSTEGLTAYLRTNETPTFFGDLAFQANGQRKNMEGSSRQYMPIASADSNEVLRYESSQIEVVDSKIARTAPSLGYEPMQYNIPGWIDKELQVYPCEKGCVYHNQECQPCALGTFRSEEDIDCRPCGKGTFADVEGLDSCRPCPEGAICNPKTLVAKEHYYPMIIQGNQTGQDDHLFKKSPGKECVNPNRILNTTIYEACRPISVCVGGDSPCLGTNRGLLCGQCGDGETYAGFMQGRRKCNKCPKREVILAQSIGLFIMYALLIRTISSCALKSAKQASSLSCAILRTLFHFLQVLGIVVEATRIDSSGMMAAFNVPLELLLRPLEVLKLDCLREFTNTNLATKDYAHIACVTIPICFGAIAACHILEGLYGYAHVILTAIPNCVRECYKVRPDRAAKQWHDRHRWKKSSKEDEEVAKDDASSVGSGMENVIGRDRSASSESGSSMSDVSSISGRKKKNRGEYSKINGPGGTFVRMHEGFDLQEHLRTYFRECMVALIFLYPIVVRQTRRAIACTTLKGFEYEGGHALSERMIVNFDVVCQSAEWENIIGPARAVHLGVLVSMPLFVLILLLWLKNECFNCEYRTITQALFVGYSPDKAYWEVVMFLRTGLIIQAAHSSTLSRRCLLMLLVMVICMCLHIELSPYQPTDRQVLHHFDLMGMTGIILTIVSGMVCQYELDDDLAGSWEFSPAFQTGTLVCVMIVNVVVVLYGLAVLTFNTISLKLQAIMQSSGELSVDASATNFDWVVRKVFRGMNPVGYYTRNGRHFIDVSKLDEGERRFLVLSLTETMSACFDSGSKIHTWLLENAINEAFNRAMQARSALIRNLYETHGGRRFYLFNLFGFVKLFQVNVRPPDVPTSTTKGNQELVRQVNCMLGKKENDQKMLQGVFGRGSNGEAEGDDDQTTRNGVTVEELHNALNSVNVDVLERHPNIHRPAEKPKPVVKEEKKDDELKPDHYALTWKPLASLANFEGLAKTWGSLVIDKNAKPFNNKQVPDEDLWNGMERDHYQYKEHSAYAHRERELEESYAMMQEEILTLKVILHEAEAYDLPMLVDGRTAEPSKTTPVPSTGVATDMVLNQVLSKESRGETVRKVTKV